MSQVDLERMLRRLIVKSFPRLRSRPISIDWGIQDELLYYAVHGEQMAIRVSECLEQARRSALEAGIVHELCHIDMELRLGRYSRHLAWDRYARLRWYRIREERRVELRVLELGYREGLLDLMRFTYRLGFTFDREHGLSYTEVVRTKG